MAINMINRFELGQWFTPGWAAEAIVESEFGWLTPGSRVVEPACGDGSFLCALPSNLDVIGVEIDPVVAERARKASGRKILVGDFRDVPREQLGEVNAILGNPPFQANLIAGFLDKSAELLLDGGVAGFILPAYIFQTSSKVETYSAKFSIAQRLLPRNLFPGLKMPLVFATFTKDQKRTLHGFLLYREAQEIRAIDRRWQESVSSARDPRGVWYSVVHQILVQLGGEADLEQIYKAVQPRRPTGNPHWKPQVRKVLQQIGDFVRTAPARYAIA